MKFCAIDSEGDTGEKGLLGFSWWSDESSGYTESWTDARSVLLEHANKGYTFVAHNAEYDSSVIFWNNKEHTRLVYFNSKFNHAEWFYDENKPPAHIWDSLGLSGNLSLANVGKAIGLEKYDTPQNLLSDDVSKYRWKCEKHGQWECVTCYATRDAEIVYSFIQSYQQFMSRYRQEPKRTIGSASVSIWRAIEQLQPIWLKNDRHREFARQAYYGGRTECFKVGFITPCYVADVNSMYPYVMSTRPLPNPEFTFYSDSSKLDDYWLQYEGCTECTVYVPSCYVPVLPVRDNNKLVFPTGTFRGTWVNAELRAAVERGAQIRKVHAVLYSAQNMYPFTNYVNQLRALRVKYKEEHNPQEQTVKILLNSLYGRIGLQDCQIEEHIEPMPEGSSSYMFPDRSIRVVSGQAYMKLEKQNYAHSRYGNVLWAAHITAYARLHLLNYLERCGTSLVYCDTDSVFSQSAIDIEGNGLGQLGQSDFYDEAHIIGPKLYRLVSSDGSKVVKAKGVKQAVADKYIETGEVSFMTAYRPREMLNGGGNAGSWYETKRTRQTVQDKRVVLDYDAVESGLLFSDTVPLSYSLSE